MKSECIAAVRAAAPGRAISDTKLTKIEESIIGEMRNLARKDRQRWAGLSHEQRVSEATAQAMAAVHAQAALKEYRASLQVLRAAESEIRIAQNMTQKLTRSQALVRDIEQTGIYTDAVRNETVAHLGDLIDAASSRDGTGVLRNLGMRLFDLHNPQLTKDVVREVFRNADGHTGSAAAKAGAKAWLEAIEGLRQRFNSAGGNVGKLGYGYLSQAHDALRVREAGADAWSAKVLPLLDRQQYVRADGALMSDAEVVQMLKAAHETLASGGSNKSEPGQFKGSGSRSNHGSEQRVLHFRDGDAWIEYMGSFGQGSLYDSMMGHMGAMARDIALTERHGPNPEQWFKVQDDLAARADSRGSKANRSVMNTPDAYWAIASGKTGAAENRTIAAWGQNLRNVQTAAKLGSAVITSFTDVGTVATTLHFNRLPYLGYLSNLAKHAVSKEHREFLQSHGVIGEAMISTLNRWTGENLTHSLTGRVAGSVMKLSLMNAWTDGLRGAFQATMMSGFAKKLGTAWDQIDEWDRRLMQSKGVTEADWGVITRAQATERNGVKYLTADSIRATGAEHAAQAATKWLAFVSDEAQFAVINPDMATRAAVTWGGAQAGTFKGEAIRCFGQFKSFPIAMMTRHWRRIFETEQGLEGAPLGYGGGSPAVNRMAAFAALNISSMLLGAVVMQAKAIVTGKDPYDMEDGRFWMRAQAQGGGLGYLGDLLFKDPTEQRGNTYEQAAGVAFGPVAGAAAGLVGDLGLVNAWEAAKGKDTRIAAEALRWTNSNLPYSNLWQTRAMWEHWMLHNAQEAVNPGYLDRMKERARKDWGQEFWWEPGEAAPDRAPDLSKAVGG